MPSPRTSCTLTPHPQLVMTHDAIHDMAHPQQVPPLNAW